MTIRLTKMQWTGLHRRDRNSSVDLAPVTTFLGPNDTGKTTMLRLPELVITGPSAGTWPLLGDARYDFVVELDFQGVGSFARGRHGGAHFVNADGLPVKIGDAKALFQMRLGTAHAVSISDLLARSGRKRLEWLTEAGILPPPTGADERDTLPPGQLPELLSLADDPRIHRIAHRFVDVDPPPFLQLVGHALGERAKENEAVIRSLRGALDRYTPPPGDLPAGTPAQYRETLVEIDREVAELEHRRGTIDGQASGRTALATRAAELERQLNGLGDPQIEQRQVEAAEAALAKVRKAPADIAEKIAAWTERSKEADQQGIAAARACFDLADKSDAVQPILRAWSLRPTQIAARVTALDELQDLEAFILTDLDHDQRAVVLVKQIRAYAELVDWHWEGDEIVGEWREGHAPPIPEEVRVALEVVAHVEPELAEQRRIKNDCDKRIAEYQAEIRNNENRRASLERDVVRAEGVLQAAIARRDAAREQRERLVEELGTLREQIEPLDAVDDRQVLEALDALRRRRAVVQRTHDLLNDRAAVETARTEQEEKLRLATVLRDRIRHARDVVEATQRVVLEHAVRELLKPASDFTQAVMGLGLELDLVDQDTTLYLVEDTTIPTKIPWETASHSQQTIAAVAFYIAVVQRIKGWRAVIIDDLEHVARDRRDKLMAALDDLVRRDQIDQVLVAGVDDGWTPRVGRVVRLAPRPG